MLSRYRTRAHTHTIFDNFAQSFRLKRKYFCTTCRPRLGTEKFENIFTDRFNIPSRESEISMMIYALTVQMFRQNVYRQIVKRFVDLTPPRF